MKFFAGVRRRPRTTWLDFGGDLDDRGCRHFIKDFSMKVFRGLGHWPRNIQLNFGGAYILRRGVVVAEPG